MLLLNKFSIARAVCINTINHSKISVRCITQTLFIFSVHICVIIVSFMKRDNSTKSLIPSTPQDRQTDKCPCRVSPRIRCPPSHTTHQEDLRSLPDQVQGCWEQALQRKDGRASRPVLQRTRSHPRKCHSQWIGEILSLLSTEY